MEEKLEALRVACYLVVAASAIHTLVSSRANGARCLGWAILAIALPFFGWLIYLAATSPPVSKSARLVEATISALITALGAVLLFLIVDDAVRWHGPENYGAFIGLILGPAILVCQIPFLVHHYVLLKDRKWQFAVFQSPIIFTGGTFDYLLLALFR